jgi:hypothetical protein
MEHGTGKSVLLLPAAVIVLLVFPNRLACFLLRLFWSNSDVLELAIIHLQQLSPLPVAFTAQSVGRSEAIEDWVEVAW